MVDIRKGKILYLVKQDQAEIVYKSRSRLRRYKSGTGAEQHRYDRHQHHHAAHLKNITQIGPCSSVDSLIDDHAHDAGYRHVKEHLHDDKERSNNGVFLVFPKIAHQPLNFHDLQKRLRSQPSSYL